MRPTFTLDVDWNMDGTYDSLDNGRMMTSLRVRRGKRNVIKPNGDGFEEDEAGQMITSLVDLYDWYNPFVNTDVGAGKYFRLRVNTPSGQTFSLVTGKLNEPVMNEGRGTRRMQLTGGDGWNTLRDQTNRVNIELQEDLYGDDAMNLLLDAIGWPTLWGRDLSGGVDLHQYWYAQDKSAASALYDLTFSEMGSMWIAGDGKVTFRNRHFADSSLFTITDNDVYMGSVKILDPWDVVRNSIRVTASKYEIQSAVQLWSSIDVIWLNPGETRDDIFATYTYNGEGVIGTNIIQPVAGVDYIANTQSDGSGVNITADFSVVATPFSNAAKLTVQNNHVSALGYLILNKLRGDALTKKGETSEANDSLSQGRYQIRSLDLSYEWIQNINVARAVARFLKDTLAYPKKVISFQLVDCPEKQFAMDLGKQVDVNIEGKGIVGTYRVYYLEHEWMDMAGMATRSTFYLEPVAPPDNYWILPARIPFKVAF